MPYFFSAMGVFFFPLVLICVVNIVLAIRKAADLYGSTLKAGPRLERGLHAILFWGAVAAVLGVLGQSIGIYNALGAISRAAEISPAVVARGFAESFTTTIFGLVILIVSAILWFIFLRRYRSIESVKR